jgi:hypothetical protein
MIVGYRENTTKEKTIKDIISKLTETYQFKKKVSIKKYPNSPYLHEQL